MGTLGSKELLVPLLQKLSFPIIPQWHKNDDDR